MIKNYLTVAIRNIARNKTFSAINILGLAIGMACCILILLYVQDELSYDQHHENAHRIYRIAVEDENRRSYASGRDHVIANGTGTCQRLSRSHRGCAVLWRG